MFDLTVDNTITIITSSAEAKNFISIIAIVIVLYIFYQLVNIIFLSNKKRKFQKLVKNMPNEKKTKNVTVQNQPVVTASERQDDIRNLLRGKK